MGKGGAGDFPFRNMKLPLEERVADLVGRLSVEEKALQLLHEAPALPRLGIPAYNYWSEGLHGVARAGRATVFPQAISMAATFDDGLLRRAATVISDEARAKFNIVREKFGDVLQYQGLSYWTPNINIFRDPRWGRGQETYGEDPCLTSRMGVAMVEGLQGDDPKRMKVAACAKHFAVHSGPEKLRHEFDARTSEHDLRDTYLPAFKALVDAGVEIVMGAYNRTNGEVCCGSPTLLGKILRGEWGFKGHVVSDCWAIRDFHEFHKVTKTSEESAALAINNGCDVNCGCAFNFLANAVRQGMVSEETLDRALTRALATRFKLGLFDEPGKGPWDRLGAESIGKPAHRALALEAAEKGIVLLKNEGVLPLDRDMRYLYMTGPNAADVEILLGNYYGMSERLVSPIEGIAAEAPASMKLDYRKGCLLDRPAPNPIEWSVGEAKAADAVVVFVGLHPLLEGEEGDAIASPERGDRSELSLPPSQAAYVRKIADTGTPMVLVVCSGSPVALDGLEDLAKAVVWLGVPGEEGGTALARILFGKVNPSGRLPITFPKSLDQLPPFEDYAMEGRTYRYSTAEPLYPFGFGLSYSKISYSGARADRARLAEGESLRASVELACLSGPDAEEVVQAYVRPKAAIEGAPLLRLVDFKRVGVKSGGRAKAEFVVPREAFATVGEDGVARCVPGAYELVLAGSVPTGRAAELGAGAPAVLEVEIA